MLSPSGGHMVYEKGAEENQKGHGCCAVDFQAQALGRMRQQSKIRLNLLEVPQVQP